MPGKKSLKKMEKTQDAEPTEKEATTTKKREKIVGSVNAITGSSPELLDAMKKMKAITPPAVASQFNLKTSVAKKILDDLKVQGKLNLVAATNNLKVYALAKN